VGPVGCPDASLSYWKGGVGRETSVRLDCVSVNFTDQIAYLHFYFILSAICLNVATIGYAHPPEFPIRAPSEKLLSERIARALRTVPIFVEAIERERKHGLGRSQAWMRPNKQDMGDNRAPRKQNRSRTSRL
jgi:hypothetical protein